MNREDLTTLEDHIVNCQLLHIAIHAIESLRSYLLPVGVAEKWIAEMKEEAGFQVSQHDENRETFLPK